MQHLWPGAMPRPFTPTRPFTPPPTAPDRDVAAEQEAAAVAEDLRSLGDVERQLDDVDVALRRLDDGTYGTCETCGHVIDEPVLETSPATRQCTSCAPPTAGTLFAPTLA